jgi:hypothetical protein
MSFQKILGLVGLAVAVVGAFVSIPYAALVLGLVIGSSIAGEHHVRVIVSALALSAFAGAFGAVPGIGNYLTSIVSNIGALAVGVALTVILVNIYNRFKP